MKKILVVYGTKEGQTSKIARVMAKELRKLGHSTQLVSAENIHASVNPEDFDGVVTGASVHMAKYPTAFRKWVKDNSQSLERIPTAFFSVCLGVLEKSNTETQKNVRSIAEDFFNWSGWQPMMWTTFPGALQYSKYGWFVRLMMKRIAKKAGGATDTSRDYEYTDWKDVRQFACEFSALMLKEQEGRRSQLESWGDHNFAKL